MRARLLTALAAAFLAIVLAGCGGSKPSVSGESSAALIDGNALAFVAFDSDLGSDQWQTVDGLLDKFPAREKILDFLRFSLSQQDLRYDRDIDPALGPELDLAVAMNGGQVAFAVLTQPDDVDKLKALVHKLNDSDEPIVYRKVGDWYALSTSDQSLDGVLAAEGGRTLADDAEFKEATDLLQPDALLKAYLNVKSLVPLIEGYLRSEGQTAPKDLYGLDQVSWFSAALEAKDNGIRFEGAMKGAGVPRLAGGGDYDSKLVRSIPGDALALVAFRGGDAVDNLRALEAESGTRLQRELGISLEDLVALFRNEVAFYVRPGSPLPEFSLALETPNEQQALAAADRVMAALAHKVRGRITSAEEGGVTVKTLTVPDFPLSIHYAGFDGKVFATTSETGIRDFRAAGDKLPSNPVYLGAREAGGVPDATSGLIWANLEDGIAAIERFAAGDGERIPPDVKENLEPLRSLIGYSTVEGDVARFAAFLEIR